MQRGVGQSPVRVGVVTRSVWPLCSSSLAVWEENIWGEERGFYGSDVGLLPARLSPTPKQIYFSFRRNVVSDEADRTSAGNLNERDENITHEKANS